MILTSTQALGIWSHFFYDYIVAPLIFHSYLPCNFHMQLLGTSLYLSLCASDSDSHFKSEDSNNRTFLLWLGAQPLEHDKTKKTLGYATNSWLQLFLDSWLKMTKTQIGLNSDFPLLSSSLTQKFWFGDRNQNSIRTFTESFDLEYNITIYFNKHLK